MALNWTARSDSRSWYCLALTRSCHTSTHNCSDSSCRYLSTCFTLVYLEVMVNRQEVLLQWEWTTEAFFEVSDSQFGEILVEPLDQLLHHQPHVLKTVTLNPVTL